MSFYPNRREQVEGVGNAPATPLNPPRWKSANTTPSGQQNNQSSQPPPAGGLFGSSTQTSQAGGGGLFGSSTQTSQPQQGGGLFGSSTTQQNTGGGGGGMFGGNTQQNTGGGGLFGNTTNQQQQSNTGGMFGQSTSQPQQSGGLFGGSLFGNTQNKPGGLFGASTNTGTNTGQGGLFGGNAQNTTSGGTSLFGGSAQQNNTAGSSLFGRPNPNGNQAQQQSIFGLSASQPTYTQPSLLGASQYRAGSRTTPFAGKLSMGQTAAPQPPAPGATKYSYDGMKPTTRFTELVDDVQKELEAIDKMIQMQEKFCRDIEGFVPKHGDDVEGLGRDVEYIREKVEASEQSLGVDAQGVQAQQRVLAGDRKDFVRCQRVVDMLQHPQQYHYNGLMYGSTRLPSASTTAIDASDAEKKDMDLAGNYFTPLATSLKTTLDTYASNLSEIEAHMRVIEHSTQMQAQQLAARRAGVGAQANSEDTVRELAETLRGFEDSILNAAGLVGQCREGVNDVILGRVQSREAGRRW